VPAVLKNKACICRDCISGFQSDNVQAMSLDIQPGDFYVDPDGRFVFTSHYLLRRGWCCENGCRHCPYREPATTAN
jgi:hypothetical protein